MFGTLEKDEELVSQIEETVEETVSVDEDTVPTSVEFIAENKRYVLEFDRMSAMRAEKLFDLSLNEAISGKSSAIENLFAAAFIKNHPHTKPSVIKRIWDGMKEKQELYQILVAMYGNTAGSVLEEPEEGKGTSWKAKQIYPTLLPAWKQATVQKNCFGKRYQNTQLSE